MKSRNKLHVRENSCQVASVSQGSEWIVCWDCILVIMVINTVHRFHVDDDRRRVLGQQRGRLLEEWRGSLDGSSGSCSFSWSTPCSGSGLNPGDGMVMGFSAAFTQEPLEDVAQTPGVMIASIWTTQMDTIKARTWRTPIEILLELGWKWMWGNLNMLLDIRVLKFISKNLICIFRQFTFTLRLI